MSKSEVVDCEMNFWICLLKVYTINECFDEVRRIRRVLEDLGLVWIDHYNKESGCEIEIEKVA